MGRPRIGAVSYLNTKPLVSGLRVDHADYDLRFDLPSRLADQLANGQLDVALIPVIEVVADPTYTVVSDACIACRGPVWSVKLISREPLDRIQSLVLDEGSRTSQALARILLEQQFGSRPECRLLGLEEDWTRTTADAALIIGDRAMKAEHDQFPVSMDLGQAWHQWTGQPFVFAVWAARRGTDLGQLAAWLSSARDHGLGRLREIAAQQADRYRLTEDECHRYLDEYIYYYLGDDEKRGMETYFQHAAELSLIARTLPLQFHDCQTA